MAKKQNKKDFPEPRINKEITGYSEVRLVYKEHKDQHSENDFSKVVSWYEAQKISQNYHLDLIEINGNAKPPIIRLADYSKYLYELKKQLKQKKKNNSSLKEIQLSANISAHDLGIKLNHAKEFIKAGDKVKVVLSLRGRELARREENKKGFLIFIDEMINSGIASLESAPRDEAQKSIVIFKHK